MVNPAALWEQLVAHVQQLPSDAQERFVLGHWAKFVTPYAADTDFAGPSRYKFELDDLSDSGAPHPVGWDADGRGTTFLDESMFTSTAPATDANSITDHLVRYVGAFLWLDREAGRDEAFADTATAGVAPLGDVKRARRRAATNRAAQEPLMVVITELEPYWTALFNTEIPATPTPIRSTSWR